MNYLFKGNLRGFYCGDCYDYLYNATVKIYAVDMSAETTQLAVAREKETFHQRSADELNTLSKRLLYETKTDELGNFVVELSDKQNYKGGAFDIDFECGTVPIRFKPKTPPKPHAPVQFHITTHQPLWKELPDNTQMLSAYWEYGISYNFWCALLRLFGFYVVCGRLSDCKTKVGLSGLKVKAYDVDLIEDDFLGEAFTDVDGHYKIYYTEADFSKTIFSWLNVEWPAGPDLYFSVESSSGVVLFQEDREVGHQKDRENAPNCFCHNFCIDGSRYETPWFTSIGNFSITTDIDGSGKTVAALSGAGGVGYGFFNSVNLRGYATKKVPTAPSSPLYYRFMYSLDNSSWQPVTETQMDNGRLRVAQRALTWHGTTDWQDVVIDKNQTASIADSIPPDAWPAPKPDHVIRLDANGWVRVDQVCLDNGFLGPLMSVNTRTLVPAGDANLGQTAGQAVTGANQKNGHLVYFKFQTTDDPTNLLSPNFHEQVQMAQIYVNNWNEVNLLKLEELFAGGGTGCTPISRAAHVDYTADHELLHSWVIAISSSAVPGGITGLPSGNLPRGNAAIIDLVTLAGLTPPFSSWPSCAYKLTLTTVRKLTNGETGGNDWSKSSEVIFCK